MQNTSTIILIVLVALALIAFFVFRNRKDRKEVFPPEATDDAVQEERESLERNKKKL